MRKVLLMIGAAALAASMPALAEKGGKGGGGGHGGGKGHAAQSHGGGGNGGGKGHHMGGSGKPAKRSSRAVGVTGQSGSSRKVGT